MTILSYLSDRTSSGTRFICIEHVESNSPLILLAQRRVFDTLIYLAPLNGYKPCHIRQIEGDNKHFRRFELPAELALPVYREILKRPEFTDITHLRGAT